MILYKVLVTSIILIVYLNPVENSNILVFLPSKARSHGVPFYPLFHELAKRGHNITLFGYYPMKVKSANVTNILIEANIEVFSIGLSNLRSYSRLFNWIYLHDELQNYFSQLLREKQLQDLLNSVNTKFDLVFVELYHLDGSFALSQRFNCPIIALSFQPMLSIYHWIFASPTTFSYIPHSYLPYTDVMTFWQRSINSFFMMFTALYYNYVSIPRYQEKVDFMLASTGHRIPTIQELTRNVSLVLVESHFSCANVRPNVPKVIDVAGIHIEALKPLPSDIKTFMDEAEYGVIYVSLGTLIDPQLAGELGLKLVNIFRRLPQRIIWKWKTNTFENATKNLMIREWLPQIDILNHSKCRLFVSHGGYHSLMETIYSGIPILGLPFFTDQHYNMAYIQKIRIGKKIDPEANEKEIQEAIYELLNDNTYQDNSKKHSQLFKDRPVNPLNTAVFWTEYVLRHKGAHHLNTVAQDLYWYEYVLLDVLFVPLLAIVALMYIILIILKKLSYAFKSAMDNKNNSVKLKRKKTE